MSHSSLTSASFDWLINANAPDSILGNLGEYTEWMPYPLPAEVGHGGAEAYNLVTGMTLIRAETHYQPTMRGQAVPLAEVNLAFSEPSLMVQSLVTGQAFINDMESGRQFVYSRGNDVFRFADRLKVVPTHDCSTDIELMSLMIGESVLATLLGEGQAKTLLKRLNLFPAPQISIRPTPAYVNKPLHTALDPSLRPPLKLVVAQARTLEYLVTLSQSIQDEKPSHQTGFDKKLVHRLHDYLLQLEGGMPTLLELASMFARSAQLLNDDFTAEYGQSIYTFMQERRLQQAHEAILKTDIALKQLSERMGYTHVSNFSAAFKRRFGYAPGYLRKSMFTQPMADSTLSQD